MDECKEKRIVSQTISVVCALCGEVVKVNNKHEETPFVLRNNKLLFDCPNCKYVYNVPKKDI